MVSSSLIGTLREIADRVSQQTIDIHSYEDNEQDIDAVFEIMTADTYITDNNLIGEIVDINNREILNRILFVGDSWEMVNGTSYSLTHLPKLLDYSKNVDLLRSQY